MSELSGLIKGLHHVTVDADGAQEDMDFMTRVLGQRHLKATVRFDGGRERAVYHMYYGSRVGSGGVFTTFPWRNIGLQGRTGSGQINHTRFSVPPDSIEWWHRHLSNHGAQPGAIGERFGEQYIAFKHPSGLGLEVVGVEDPREPWTGDGVSDAGHAVRGLHSVSLGLIELQNTKEFLELLGFRQTAEDGPDVRMEVGEGGSGRSVDLHLQPDVAPGSWQHAIGLHHHVAFVVDNEDAQTKIKDYLEGDGFAGISEIKDRFYFKSIYFRSPGGVMLEVATPANWLRDETEAELGSHIHFPPWLESKREEWGTQLEPITLKQSTTSA